MNKANSVETNIFPYISKWLKSNNFCKLCRDPDKITGSINQALLQNYAYKIVHIFQKIFSPVESEDALNHTCYFMNSKIFKKFP